MALKNTFREIAIANSPKQPVMVDQLLEEAPILELVPLEPASHGLWNVYEELDSVTGNGLVDMDDELPEVSSNSKLKQIDLSIIGGKHYVGEDKAKKFGGAGNYFSTKQSSIMKKTGMDAETSILYNNLRAFAITNDSSLSGSHVFDAGGTGSTNYSIIAVKWVAGETTGLFDPNGFGRGILMDIQAINGGELFEHSTTTEEGTKNILSYGVRYKSYFGIQLANARYVSSIVNIDITNDALPSEAQLDSLITSVRGQMGGNTWLYMHPKVLTALYKYKGASLRTTTDVLDNNRVFDAWNGIPILTSYNFKDGTEARVV